MGCDNSKTIRVQPLGTPAVNNNKLTTEGSKRQTSKGESGHPDLNTNKVKSKNSRQRSAAASKNVMGSSSSLDDERSLDSDRGFSATSKQSADSGLGEEYAHVITEFSEEDKIRQVENDFAPRDGLGKSNIIFHVIIFITLPQFLFSFPQAQSQPALLVRRFMVFGSLSMRL